MFYGAPIRSLDDISRLRRTGFDFGEIAMANAGARKMWWESGLINGGSGKFFLLAHGSLEGRLQRQGPTDKARSVIMEKALVGLCGPLTKPWGYVMKVRLRQTKILSRRQRTVSFVNRREVNLRSSCAWSIEEGLFNSNLQTCRETPHL
jgi:hypothetical protein